MTSKERTFGSISRLAVSLVLLVAAAQAAGAKGLFRLTKDSVPVFRGVAVSADLAGPLMRAVSDYGEYEAAARVNIHDEYYPAIEIGIGSASHDDEVTAIHYKTSAPYFRIGGDINLLKKKHTGNRLYVGLRYAFTSYKVDLAHPALTDPVWGPSPVDIKGEKCSQQWAEVVFGLDAKVCGPLHLGWAVRYKRRTSHDEGQLGNTWYVPGYGKCGSSRLGANFNVIIDI